MCYIRSIIIALGNCTKSSHVPEVISVCKDVNIIYSLTNKAKICRCYTTYHSMLFTFYRGQLSENGFLHIDLGFRLHDLKNWLKAHILTAEEDNAKGTVLETSYSKSTVSRLVS